MSHKYCWVKKKLQIGIHNTLIFLELNKSRYITNKLLNINCYTS